MKESHYWVKELRSAVLWRVQSNVEPCGAWKMIEPCNSIGSLYLHIDSEGYRAEIEHDRLFSEPKGRMSLRYNWVDVLVDRLFKV
jgi:hypothetical protein